MRPGEKPNPICTKCPGDQKNQPTLGLALIKGMQRKGRNYENGTILDPRDGSVYQARMELSPDGQKLMMRGYLGIDLFGQSQIWRRLTRQRDGRGRQRRHCAGRRHSEPPSTGPGRIEPEGCSRSADRQSRPEAVTDQAATAGCFCASRSCVE